MSNWIALVTILALLLLFAITINVGRVRVKSGVKAPLMVGDPAFERALRVQQNTLEQIVIFLPAMWIFGTVISPIYAAIIGSVWIMGRMLYAWGYYQAAEKRGSGFAISSIATIVLMIGSLGGLILQLIKSGGI